MFRQSIVDGTTVPSFASSMRASSVACNQCSVQAV